jgi:hypothetical protein
MLTQHQNDEANKNIQTVSNACLYESHRAIIKVLTAGGTAKRTSEKQGTNENNQTTSRAKPTSQIT